MPVGLCIRRLYVHYYTTALSAGDASLSPKPPSAIYVSDHPSQAAQLTRGTKIRLSTRLVLTCSLPELRGELFPALFLESGFLLIEASADVPDTRGHPTELDTGRSQAMYRFTQTH